MRNVCGTASGHSPSQATSDKAALLQLDVEGACRDFCDAGVFAKSNRRRADVRPRVCADLLFFDGEAHSDNCGRATCVGERNQTAWELQIKRKFFRSEP